MAVWSVSNVAIMHYGTPGTSIFQKTEKTTIAGNIARGLTAKWERNRSRYRNHVRSHVRFWRNWMDWEFRRSCRNITHYQLSNFSNIQQKTWNFIRIRLFAVWTEDELCYLIACSSVICPCSFCLGVQFSVHFYWKVVFFFLFTFFTFLRCGRDINPIFNSLIFNE